MCEEFLRQVDEYNKHGPQVDGIRIVGGQLMVPVGSKSNVDSLLRKFNVTYHQAARNNMPDEDSCRYTQSLLHRIDSLSTKAGQGNLLPLVIGFISGGGSALLACPKNSIALSDKINLIQELVKSGANIVELNTVRSCLSQVKGGQLARRIVGDNGRQLVTFMISDIINDPIDMIASGPTIISNNDSQRALNILEQYKINVKPTIIEAIKAKLSCKKDDTFNADLVTNLIIGNNQIALKAVQDQCEHFNYKTISLGSSICGEASEVARKLLHQVIAYRLDGDNEAKQYNGICWLGGGETTVTMKSQSHLGLGGRCQEMGLAILDEILSKQRHLSFTEVGVLFAGTDGQDGPTSSAGVHLQLNPLDRQLSGKQAQILDALQRHDSHNFFKAHLPHCLIETGPSGTNVMDIYCIIAKLR